MRKLLNITSFLAIFLMITTLSNAQLINYQRRKETEKKAVVNEQVTTKKQIVSNKYQNTVQKLLTSEQRVINYNESRYDKNRDRVLQEGEMRDLLEDLVIQVNKSGIYRISSDFLKDFDKDNDGYIDRDETFEIQGNI